jgi:para-aminobenzoate N-oxygenase AurF
LAKETAVLIDWTTPIDSSRWFFCETLTPLAYTRIYHELDESHRRRYNQLTGMLSNELILRLETGVLSVALRALESCPDADLREAVARFAADERRHAETWRRLNRLTAPEWYAASDTVLCRVPPVIEGLSRLIAHRPAAWPVIFWMQLSQEERSIEISRRCLRVPADRMEPRYAAAYREHLRDEVRHVAIDGRLLERFYMTRSRALKRLTAALFRSVIASAFIAPGPSTFRIVRTLASEYPDLQPLLPRIIAELRGLDANDDYHRMMYSRETTPLTFAWFDRCEEFHGMARVLRAYEPRNKWAVA